MEHESLEFKIIMDDGPDTEVLARLAHLDLAGPAYRAAVFKYPTRNIALRHGARIIERHEGEPPPCCSAGACRSRLGNQLHGMRIPPPSRLLSYDLGTLISYPRCYTECL
jgi:hypothetical protein